MSNNWEIEIASLIKHHGYSDTIKNAVKAAIEKEVGKDQAKSDAYHYLYSDLIKRDLEYDFKQDLNPKEYKSASAHAANCIDLSMESRKVSEIKLKDWTSNALKCYDHVILNYIQEVLKEKPKKLFGMGGERANYKHLANKEGDVRTLGYSFDSIYQFRNQMEHTQITDVKTGKVVIRQPNLYSIKKRVLSNFKTGLLILKDLFENNK